MDKDSKGNLYVYTRSGKAGISRGATAAQLFSFDPSLKFQKEWCEDCYAQSFAHAVRIDKYDNVWMVDEGSNMIVKMDQTGLVKMVIGRKPEAIDYLERFLEMGEHITPEQNRPTTSRMGTFGRPTDVDWDAAGNIYVSDGYANSRTVKLSKDGVWLKQFGTRGSGPNQFNTVHSIATDAKGLVYVADRGNRRIYVLDSELNVVRMITGMGQPWAVAITPGPTQYLWTGDSEGKMFKFTLDGKLVGWNLTTQGHGQNSCLVHSIHAESENVTLQGRLHDVERREDDLQALVRRDAGIRNSERGISN